MSTKRIFDYGSVVALVALIAFGIFAVAGGLGDDKATAGDAAREASCLEGSTDCDDLGGGSALGVCAEGVTDCVDTALGDGDGSDQICIAPEEGGSEDCKDDGSGAGTSINPVCAPDYPNCSDMCVVSSDGDVDCTGGSSGGGGSDPGQPGSVPGFSGCANNAECERLAVEAAWELLEGDGVSGEITLEGAKGVDWPNACLGVTDADIACAEVITPGFVVTLERNGLHFVFHTDTNGNAVAAGTE